MMKWELLHKEMLAEIENCWQLVMPEKEQVECAYKIAVNNWEDIKKQLSNHVFENSAAEIYFYKNIKPGLTCYIEYLTIVYLSLCYKPSGDKTILSFFWNEELKKQKKFVDKNAEFVTYYKSGSYAQDLQYFLPANNDLGNYTVTKIYDMDGQFVSSHDHLVAEMLAHEMYYGYVQKKIAELG